MTSIESGIQKTREFILDGKHKAAFRRINLTLAPLPSDDFQDLKTQVSLLQTRYSTLRKEKGMINFDEQMTQMNRISKDFFDILDDISDRSGQISELKLGMLLKVNNAETAVNRANVIVQNLKILADGGNLGLVREKGNLSTFSLPNRSTDNPAWKYVKWAKDSEALTEQLSAQRYWLEKHALDQSCKLIVHLDLGYETKYGKHGLYRLKCLLAFLKTYKDRVDIVNVPPVWSLKKGEQFENLLIVGNENDLENSFMAPSKKVSNQGGIEETYISPEPKEMKAAIEQFDEDFDEILDYLNLDIYEAREQTIEWLEKKIRE